MSKFESPLGKIKIASPCSADWNEMYGDEQKRFCGDCKLNVYNLSGMSKADAEALVMNAEGRLCVRFYQRADGSVITQDCPVGWAKMKQRTRAVLAAAFSMVMAVVTGVFFVSLLSPKRAIIGDLKIPFTEPVFQPTMGAIAPPNRNSNMANENRPVVMGNVVVPPVKKKTMVEVKGEIDARPS